jgi:hypothetical protein
MTGKKNPLTGEAGGSGKLELDSRVEYSTFPRIRNALFRLDKPEGLANDEDARGTHDATCLADEVGNASACIVCARVFRFAIPAHEAC